MTVASPFAFTDDELTHLRNHVESLLKTFYDSDIGPMCDYVITLLRTGDFDVSTLTTFAKDQLNDFLGDNTNDFVDRLMHDVVARSFLPGAAAPAPSQAPVQVAAPSVADRIQLRPGSGPSPAPVTSVNSNHNVAHSLGAPLAPGNGSAAGMPPRPGFGGPQQQPGFQFQPIEPPRFLPQSNNSLNQQRPPFQPQQLQQQPQQGFQQQPQPQPQQHQRICFQFRDQGFCSRGDACRYAHIRPDGGLRDPLQGRLGPPPTRDNPAFNAQQQANPRWPHQPLASHRPDSPPPRMAPAGASSSFPPNAASRPFPGGTHPPASPTHGGHHPGGPQPQKSLAIHNIPEEHLRVSAVEEYFSRFGSIARVTLAENPADKRAFVTFNELDAAVAAKNCPDAIFGNRFVRVSYYVEGMTFFPSSDGDREGGTGRGRGRSGRGGAHMGGAGGWYPPAPGGYYPGYPPAPYGGYYPGAAVPYGPMGMPMGGMAPSMISEQEAQERVSKAQANLTKLESMWKKITDKLETLTDAAQRAELETMAANLKKQMEAIQNRLVADPMTAELVPHMVKEVKERKKREALDAELAAIERQRNAAASGAGASAAGGAAQDKGMESDDDGLDIDVGSSAGGGSMSGSSVNVTSGSGSAAGTASGAPGGSAAATANPNWLAATQKYSLDLRPTSLLISGVPASKVQEVLTAMATYGEVTESSVLGEGQQDNQAAVVVKYKARVLAEKALAGGVPSGVLDPMEVTSLKVEWKF